MSKARSLSSFAMAAVRDPGILKSVGPVLRRLGSTNIDVAEPWWNSRAIRFISERLPPTGAAFEWGSGGSSAWLVRHGMRVNAVES